MLACRARPKGPLARPGAVLTTRNGDLQDAALDAFHQRYAGLFGRREVQRLTKQYLQGLIHGSAARTITAGVSEDGKAHPRAIQRMLSEARWDTDQVTAAVQQDLARQLNHEEGVFILGEIGFPKQGSGLVGVERQAAGANEEVRHQQVGVFLAYASPHGQALVDFRLYLPRQWCSDSVRRATAHVPHSIRYVSRRALGVSLLTRAADLGYFKGRWVVSDLPSAAAPAFRDKLDEMGWWYAGAVPPNAPVFRRRRQPSATGPAAGPEHRKPALETEGWHQVLLPRLHGRSVPYRFIGRRVLDNRDGQPGKECWLIIRRDHAGAHPRYFLSNAPGDTPFKSFALATQWLDPERHPFEPGRIPPGLARNTMRSWAGWHHHMALALMAGAFLLEWQDGSNLVSDAAGL